MKKLYNVFVDGWFIGYTWELSAEAAIAALKNGQSDNMAWTAEQSGAAVEDRAVPLFSIASQA